MQKASEAMVSVNDLNQAIDEKRRGFSEATMKRLWACEPHLAIYVESLAVHFGNPTQPKDYDLDGTGKGYDLDLVQRVAHGVGIPVVACGGAGSIEHMRAAVEHGASAVAAGQMFVFHGRRRAVLINYPDEEQLRALLP